MSELILDTKTLPEPLVKLIPSSQVKVRKTGDIITLYPIDETESADCIDRLFGMFADGKMSVDKFLAQKTADKELER